MATSEICADLLPTESIHDLVRAGRERLYLVSTVKAGDPNNDYCQAVLRAYEDQKAQRA